MKRPFTVLIVVIALVLSLGHPVMSKDCPGPAEPDKTAPPVEGIEGFPGSGFAADLLELYASGSHGPLMAIESMHRSLAGDLDFTTVSLAALLVKWESPFTARARELSAVLGRRLVKSVQDGRIHDICGGGSKLSVPAWVHLIRILDICAKSCHGTEPAASANFVALSGLAASFLLEGPVANPLKSRVAEPGFRNLPPKSGQAWRGVPGGISLSEQGVLEGFLSPPGECMHGVYRADPVIARPPLGETVRLMIIDSAVPAAIARSKSDSADSSAESDFVYLDPDRVKGSFDTAAILLLPGEPVPPIHFLFRGEGKCIRVHVTAVPEAVSDMPPDLEGPLPLSEEIPDEIVAALGHELAGDSWAAAESMIRAELCGEEGWDDLTDLISAFAIGAAIDREPGSRIPRALKLAEKSLRDRPSFEALKVLVSRLMAKSGKKRDAIAAVSDSPSGWIEIDSLRFGTSRLPSSMASILSETDMGPLSTAWARTALKVNPGDLNAAVLLALDRNCPQGERFETLRVACAMADASTVFSGDAVLGMTLSKTGRHLEAARAFLDISRPSSAQAVRMNGKCLPLQMHSLAAAELIRAGAWAEATAEIGLLAETLGPTREILRKAYLVNGRVNGREGEEILKTARMFHPGWKWAAVLTGTLNEAVPISDMPQNLASYPQPSGEAEEGDLTSGDLLVIDDMLSVRVHGDLSWGAAGCTRTRILSAAGASAAGEMAFPGGAEVLAAHCIKPDGTVLGAERVRGKESLSVHGIAKGDIVVQAWWTTGGATAGTSLDFDSLPLRFGVFGFAMKNTGVNVSTLKVTCPADFPLHSVVTGEIEVSDDVTDGIRTTVWTARKMKPWFEEAGAPPEETHAPNARVGGGLTWEEAGEVINGRIEAFCKPSSELEILASKWSRPDLLDQSKIKGLYSEIFDRISGTSMNADFNGTASGALESGKGNRLGVLKACLDLMGIPSVPVLVNPRFITRDPWPFPDPESFSHCLLRIPLPGGDFWLDPASRFTPPGYLLEPVSGTMGLAVDASGGRIQEIASPEPGFETFIGIDASIGSGGATRISYTETHTGTTAVYMRESYSRMDNRNMKASIEAGLRRHYPGLAMISCGVSKIGSPESPLAITAIFNVPSPKSEIPKKGAGFFSLPNILPGTRLAGTLADRGARTTPLLVPATRAVRARAVIQTPSGMEFTSWAEECESPFGWYRRREDFTAGPGSSNGVLAVETALVLPMQVVKAKDYGEFARFCRNADSLDSKSSQGVMKDRTDEGFSPSPPSEKQGNSPAGR